MTGGVFTIYKAVCATTGKCYVGFDSHWPRRRGQHMRDALSYGCDYKFHRAIRKYGWSDFLWEVVYQSRDGAHCLREMEPHFIAESSSVSGGYNLASGGRGALGVKRSAETRARIVEAWARRPRPLGLRLPQERKDRIGAAHSGRALPDGHRAKIGAALAGRKFSAETIQKMSAAQRRRVHASPPADQRLKISAALAGHAVSEETRRKIGAKNRGRVRTPEQRAKISAGMKRHHEITN